MVSTGVRYMFHGCLTVHTPGLCMAPLMMMTVHAAIIVFATSGTNALFRLELGFHFRNTYMEVSKDLGGPFWASI